MASKSSTILHKMWEKAHHSTTLWRHLLVCLKVASSGYGRQVSDLNGFLLSSVIIFVSVTVAMAPKNPGGTLLTGITGQRCETFEAMTDTQVQSSLTGLTGPDSRHADPLYHRSYSACTPSYVPQHIINVGAHVGCIFISREGTGLVFESLVRSGYWVPMGAN